MKPIEIIEKKFIFNRKIYLCKRCREVVYPNENYCIRCGLELSFDDWGLEDGTNKSIQQREVKDQ